MSRSLSLPRGRLFILEASVFISMLGVGIIVPFLPLYARQMGASATVMGLIFSAFSASRALAMPQVGMLSDRRGRKPFLAAGLAGYGLMALLLVWTTTPWGLVANRVCQGLFAAMVLPVAMALVADLTPPGHEGRIFGGFNTSFLLGFALGPLVGGLIYDHLSLEANFLVMAGLSLISLFMVLVWVREPGGRRPARAFLGWRGLRQFLRDPGLAAVFLARVGGAMGMGCFIAFLPVLARNQGLSNTQLGWLLAANVLVMTGLQTPAGRLADRLSRRWLALAGMALAGLCKAALPWGTGFWGLMALCLAEGLASGLSLPALTALAVSHGRRLGAGMGLTMGFYGMALSLGVSLGPVLGGVAADLWRLPAAFWLAGAATLAGAGCLLRSAVEGPPAPPLVVRGLD